MGIVKAKNLTFEYIRRDEDGNVEGITKAVDNVSIDIKQGDFVAVLGHNGSGKSTFAKHLNALVMPTEGTVWVDGMPCHHMPELYRLVGRPEKGERIVRRILRDFYRPAPDGLCGNDDCGQMSAWLLCWATTRAFGCSSRSN